MQFQTTWIHIKVIISDSPTFLFRYLSSSYPSIDFENYSLNVNEPIFKCLEKIV